MQKLNPQLIEDILALTPLQEGMLFNYLQDPLNDPHFEQLNLEICGTIDRQLFVNAWQAVCQTNEMLRTVFRWEKLAKPSLVILKEHQCPVTFFDLSTQVNDQKKTALAEIKAKDRCAVFDLSEVPFRVILCKLDETNYEMIISNHHILYDCWSSAVILKEFFAAYRALSSGEAFTPPAKPQFKMFARWLQEQYGKNTAKHEEYWETYLKGFLQQPGIPIPKKSKVRQMKNTGHEQFLLPAELKNKLDVFIRDHQLTMASLLYSA